MNRSSLLLKFCFVLALTAFVALLARTSQARGSAQESNNRWQDVTEASFELAGPRLIIPEKYRTVAIDFVALKALLSQAPLENTAVSNYTQLIISLPLPDGTSEEFRVIESPIMAPELALKFPEIKTYIAQGITDPTTSGRLDTTPFGFHAIIFSTRGTIYIDPYSRNDTTHYLSYFKRDLTGPETDFAELGPLGEGENLEALTAQMQAGGTTAGPELRTYRTAVAATGEYTVFHGGTVPLGMAAITTAINRVTGVYEREVAVRLQLIANNNLIVYTDGTTDPYSNSDGVAMLAQNQANLDAVIGSANYDVGHVFSTGGGGVAFLAVICNPSSKARGVTGLSSPTGDPFYIDYVAHELGHQFGGNHTFNGNAGACSGGNRNALTAYEPGSGSTIMAYAGICGNQDLQPNSDDYFHTISFDEMIAHTQTGGGNSCAAITTTGNSAPVVEAGTGGFTIPINTPFRLVGSATDPDGDTLTYNWEEFDLGPAGHPNTPSGNAPIFRSFPSVATPERIFPKISDIVNNTQTIGEILPSYSRSLTFRLTARDNQVAPGAGGVAYDTIAFSVTNTAGPFVVTNPNTAIVWDTNSVQPVTWNVANTNAAPVNCSAVDILLSTDGGYTYPTTLQTNTPNDGSTTVTVPNISPSTTARVAVECADNIFFDISNTNFSIEVGVPTADLSIVKSVVPNTPVNLGDTLTYTIAITNGGTLTATATITDTFPDGLTDITCNGIPGDLSDTPDIGPGGEAVTYECTAEVDAGLAVEIEKTADVTVVDPGTAVTYTITIHNPHTAITLTNVTVTDPDATGCLPTLGTPFTLAPSASQIFICSGNIITETITNTATVTATAELINVAQASAPEDPGGLLTSAPVVSHVNLANTASVTVTVQANFVIYLPTVLKN